MYLARIQHGNGYHYAIRKSFFDHSLQCYCFRQLIDLGRSPAQYIHRFSDDVIYFDEELEQVVDGECDGDPTLVLEDLLWQFLPLDEQKRIGDFRRTKNLKLSKLSTEEKEEITKHLHIFDRRRLYYLRYGAVDQSRIYRLPDKLYRPLLYKCRDEKEYYFNKLELSLASSELKKYVFVIFNLQHHFSESFSSFMPEALDENSVEESFLREICGLNRDNSFWQDSGSTSSLRHHLQSYVIRFFDFGYSHRSYTSDFFSSFRAKHSSFKWPERKITITQERVNEIFGKSLSCLKKMNERELARVFRRRAKKYHPDGGGDPEKFIALIETYEALKTKLTS